MVEIVVIGVIYCVMLGIFAAVVLTGHDPGPFATYSVAIITALLPFLRRKPSDDESTEERTPDNERE